MGIRKSQVDKIVKAHREVEKAEASGDEKAVQRAMNTLRNCSDRNATREERAAAWRQMS